jgi:hypothetical protein
VIQRELMLVNGLAIVDSAPKFDNCVLEDRARQLRIERVLR